MSSNIIGNGKNQYKKNFCIGGIFGPIVFLINDIIGSFITPDYNPIIHAVSELTQTGSKNTVLLSILFLIAALGLVIFAIGIIRNNKFSNNKLIFFGGNFICLLGIFSALTGTIFPMDPFGTETTFAGEMHKYLTLINIILILMAIPLIGTGFYKEKGWNSFRLYSLITVFTMIIFGVLTGVIMMWQLELLGLLERITIYAYQLWTFILAIILIKEK